MKKLAIFFLTIVIVIVGISYLYMNYRFNYNKAKMENRIYESYLNQEIYGNELATVINKAVNNNEINKVEKNNKGKYISNEKDSINIEIKMLDNDKIYLMEEIYRGGTDKFVQYYSIIKFKCMKLEYHQKTGKISYMFFEQITQ